MYILRLLLALLVAHAAAAQETAIHGRITGPEGEPVAAALVGLASADGEAAWTRSAADGTFRVPFPAGRAPFELSVARVGFAPYRAPVANPASARADVRLDARPALLDAVQVVGARPRLGTTPGGVAGGAGMHTASSQNQIPVEVGSLAETALLTPGAVPAAADAGGAPAVSVAGQSPAQNRITVDGASFGGAALPAEAVRSAGVITNTFDVSRGRFMGGQIAASTHAGTNDAGGALRVRGSSRPLDLGRTAAFPAPSGTFAQVSGAYGGPVVRDRLFAFAAAEAGWRGWSGDPLVRAPDAALRLRGIDPDSVRRFGAVLAGAGLPAGVGAPTASTDASAILRLDWRASEGHTLTGRFDLRESRTPATATLLSAHPAEATELRRGGGALLALSSSSATASNELRLYASVGHQRRSGESGIPRGEVWIGSDAGGTHRFSFGGSGGAERRGQRLVELSEAYQRTYARGRFRLRAGGLLAVESASAFAHPNASGTFVFDGLDALAGNRPELFTRTLRPRDDALRSLHGAAYLGQEAQVTPQLAVGYGLRAEGTRFGARPALEPAVRGAFPDLDADIPASVTLSPRVSFAYRVPTSRPGISPLSFDGGAGRFVGRLPLDGLAAAAGEVGLPASELVCIGAAAPAPRWSDFAGGAALPARCVGEADAGAGVRPADATLFAPGFRVPAVWRASLGARWQPSAYRAITVRVSLLRGDGEPVAIDRNLAAAPRMTLPQEGGRAVFAPPEGIDPASGVALPVASRLHPELGRVREIGVGGAEAAQVTVQGLLVPGGRYVVSAGYTWTRARDDAAGLAAPGGPAAYAGDDPRLAVRASADHARRHAFHLYGARQLTGRLRAGLIARLVSGAPYTPWAAGDVNGDGAANDPAFVFDPADADPEIAAGMGRLLDDAPAATRACLRRNLGRLAARNGCTGPWSPGFDLQLEYSPRGIGAERGLRVHLIASNLPGLADWVAHGPNDLRGWGQPAIPDRTLLAVRGFDPGARAYRYEVNPRFGQSLAGRARSSFSLTLQGRVVVGTDPATQSSLERARRYRAERRPAEEIRAGIGQRVRSLPALVLTRADSLGIVLDPAQTAALQRLADSVQLLLPPMLDSLAAAASLADTASSAAMPARRRQRLLAGGVVELLEAVIEQVRSILTDAQWPRLPASWREPPNPQAIVPIKPIVISGEDPP